MTQMVQGIVATVASNAMAHGAGIEGSSSSDGTSFPFDGLLSKAAVEEGQPQAYLNYLVFDKNMVLIDKKSGYEALTTAAREDGSNRPHEELATEIIVTEPGYVYIYPEASSGQVLSNDGSVPKDVYFDQFNVEHAHSAIVQSDDYYPFGLSFKSYKRENSIANKYLYNDGTERITDLDLGVDMTRYRVLDPAIGRWWQIDPLADELVEFTPYNSMFNNPIRYNDPEGDCPTCILGAGVGGLAGGAIGFFSTKGSFKDKMKAAGKGALVGAIGGAIVGSGVGLIAVSGATGLNAGIILGASGFASGAASSLTEQGFEIATGDRNEIDTKEVALDAVIGIPSNLIGAGVGKAGSGLVKNIINNIKDSQLGKEAQRSMKKQISTYLKNSGNNFTKKQFREAKKQMFNKTMDAAQQGFDKTALKIQVGADVVVETVSQKATSIVDEKVK